MGVSALQSILQQEDRAAEIIPAPGAPDPLSWMEETEAGAAAAEEPEPPSLLQVSMGEREALAGAEAEEEMAPVQILAVLEALHLPPPRLPDLAEEGEERVNGVQDRRRPEVTAEFLEEMGELLHPLLLTAELAAGEAEESAAYFLSMMAVAFR